MLTVTLAATSMGAAMVTPMPEMTHKVQVPKQRPFARMLKDLNGDISRLTAQRKLNGNRGFETNGTLWSRSTGVDGDKANWNSKHPHIVKAIKQMSLREPHMLDGEMMYFPDKESGVELYPFKLEHYPQTEWHVFDAHYLGEDGALEHVRYIDKIKTLRSLFFSVVPKKQPDKFPIKLVDFIVFSNNLAKEIEDESSTPRIGGRVIYMPSIEEAARYANEHRWEGLIFNHCDAKSVLDFEDKRPRRDIGRYKWKPVREIDVLIKSWNKGTEGKRNDGVVGSLNAYVVRDGKQVFAGRVSGLDDDERRRLIKRLDTTGAFVAEVKYRRWTVHGLLEGSMLTRVRDDKTVDEFLEEDTQ